MQERPRKVNRLGYQEPDPEERAEINAKRDGLIKSYLEQIFGPGQCKLKQQSEPRSGFPIPEQNNRQFECTRPNEN